MFKSGVETTCTTEFSTPSMEIRINNSEVLTNARPEGVSVRVSPGLPTE
jgi:hypothetical protein